MTISPMVIVGPADDAHVVGVSQRVRTLGAEPLLLDAGRFPSALRVTLGEDLDDVRIDGTHVCPSAVYVRNVGTGALQAASSAECDSAAQRFQNWLAGRDPATLYKTAVTMGCVLADGEPADSPRARAQAGPLALSFFHGVMDGSLKVRVPDALAPTIAEYRRLYEDYEPPNARYLTLHKGHFIRPRPEEERFLTAELVRDLTTTGTADKLVERVRGLAAAGYQQLTICLAPGQEDAAEDWARVLKRV